MFDPTKGVPMGTNATALMERLTAAVHEYQLETADVEQLIDRALDSARARKAEESILTDLRDLTAARDTADQAWRSMVASATRMGLSQARVAEAAGCSPAWVGRVARAVNKTEYDPQT